MTKRLVLAILSTVAISILLVGLGTMILTRVEDRRATQSDLEGTAQALAFVFSELPLGAQNDSETIRQRLRRIQDELRIADAELLVLNRNDQVLGVVPPGLEDTPIDFDTLRTEGQISGRAGSIVYAAAFGERRAFDYVVVLTADGNRLTSPIFGWVVVSALVALFTGALIAWMLGRRLAQPIVAAAATSLQIANGDLTARVAVDPDRDDEITNLGTSINHMAASLARARGLEHQFLLSVSHDLRTPLTSIRGFAEAIADGTAPNDARAAAIIGAEARRLERLVTDLLDLAKLDARQFRLEMTSTDLTQLVPDVAAGFEHEANELGVGIMVDGPEAELIVHADPDRLAQVLANLLQNALKYAHSTVLVSYRPGALGAEIVVADDGPGITTEDLPHVFERLYVAAQTPQRKETGSGLGLAIVKELVEAQGGTVAALPRPTGGTQFVIGLRA